MRERDVTAMELEPPALHRDTGLPLEALLPPSAAGYGHLQGKIKPFIDQHRIRRHDPKVKRPASSFRLR